VGLEQLQVLWEELMETALQQILLTICQFWVVQDQILALSVIKLLISEIFKLMEEEHIVEKALILVLVMLFLLIV
jgi:hypothetical protein